MSHLVTVGGASYRAGGDVVTAVGGMKSTSASALQNALEHYQAGSVIELGIVHVEGTPAHRSLTLATQPAKRSAIASILPA